MKFGQYILKFIIKEWKDLYINYRFLKALLSSFKTLVKEIKNCK